MPYVTTPDHTRIHYRDWQPEAKAARGTFVFSHGWGMGGDCWEYQAGALVRAGHRCITFDRRGCGGSDDPGRGHHFDTYADDLQLLLSQLDLQDITLVAHSMGCGEALRYCTRHGGARIARLVLIAPAAPLLRARVDNPHGLPDAFFDGVIAALLDDRAGFMRIAAPLFFGAGLPDVRVSDAMLDWGVGMAMRASAHATVAMVDAYSNEDYRPDLVNVRMPCLVIHGDRDVEPTTLERCGRPTAAGIVGAQLVVYEGAPHGLFVSHRARLNEDLLRFAGGS